MGNYVLNCYEPINEDIEILKTNKKTNLKYNLNDFIKSIKPLNHNKRKHKILKIKFSTSLIIEDARKIYNISSFPCGNIILITKDGIIYIFDNKFNLLKKQDNNEYKELCIKDNKTFITYGQSKIKVWEFIQKNNSLNSIHLINKESLINKVSIIANDDIIGITKFNIPFQCFIYEKTKNNIYQKK